MENQEEKPSYYAVIPASVRYDENLAPAEKLFYGELTCLTNKLGYCFASNNYFAKLYGVGISTISRWVKHLESCGYISVDYERNGKQIIRRIIKMNTLEGIPKMEGVFQKREEGYSKNEKGGIPKNAKIILQDNNITSNNIYPQTENPSAVKKKVFEKSEIERVCVKNNYTGMNSTPEQMADWFWQVSHTDDGGLCYKGTSITNYKTLVSILKSIDVNGKRYKQKNHVQQKTSVAKLNESYF